MGRFFSDIKNFKTYTVFSARAELKAEVAGSFLSWIWWILDPLLFMLVYFFVAVIVFGRTIQYFPIFVFIGLNTWNFFSRVVKASVKIVSSNKSIVTKVYVPKPIFILQKIGVYGFKMLVAFLITFVFMIFYQVPISWRVVWIVPLFALLGLLTFGVSTIIAHFGVFVEDLLNIITIVLQLGFYVSGIFYSIPERIGAISQPLAKVLTSCNPLAFIMSEFRNVLLYKTNPNFIVFAAWVVIGLALSALGLHIMYKHENSYVKAI